MAKEYDLPNWELTLVDTQQDVDNFLDWVDGIDGMVSVDTETWGLSWWERDFVRLVTFSDDTTGWAIPTEWWGRVISYALAKIRDKNVPVGFWNCSFDLHALEDDGYPIPHWHNVIDGYVLHHLLTPHVWHGLKWSSVQELGGWAGVGEAALKAKAEELGYGSEWWAVPVDLPEYWQYAIVDTFLTQLMIRTLGPRVSTAGMKDAYEVEMQAIAIMQRAETRGMHIDHKLAEATRRAWLDEALVLRQKLADAGLSNPNSEQQVETLFRDLGWEPEDFTETGQATLNKAVLAGLSERWPGLGPDIIQYKRLTKWVGSYLEPFANSKGRVHPGINTLRAKTGRMSITAPALQTLPSKGSAGVIRACILPEPGCELWAIDYDGQEARIFANLSGDPGMAAAYIAGDDLYTHVARIVWADPSITKDDPRRGIAKVILLAFTYGAGLDTLALASGQPHAEVERFLMQLFREFPTVRDMTGDHAIGGNYPGKPALLAQRRAVDEGLAYVNTKGGRRFSMPNGEFYKAINGLCQGSGADVLKSALVRLDRAGLADYIVVPVHDEVVFSIPKGNADIAAEAARCMEDLSWKIPLTVDVTGPLKNWGEAYV